MRSRSATDLRSNALRYLPVAWVSALAIGAEFSTHALADVFQSRTTLLVQQIFVDNVRSSSTDRDADGITTLAARFDAALTTDRIDAIGRVEGYYNEFWASNDLEGANGRGVVASRIKVLKDLFFVDALANRQDVFLSPSASSGSGLLTGQNQAQQTDYSISPFLRTDLFDLADLEVRATYAQVFFDQPRVGPALVLLSDITAKQLSGKISTGKRASFYEAIVSADVLETDTGFEQRNVIGSLYLNVTPAFSAIGRIGYERIVDPSIIAIREPVWSVGGRYEVSKNSLVQLEYGHRYGDVSWLGSVQLALTPRVALNGNYTDTLVPIQLSLTRSVEDLFNQDGVLTIPAATLPGISDPTAVDKIIRDKNANLIATYKIDLRTYELSARHVERQFPGLVDSEQLLEFRVAIKEQLSRQLGYRLSLDYVDLYDPLAGNPMFKNYRADLEFDYQFNQDYRFLGGYFWRLNSPVTGLGNQDTYENVLRFGVQRTF